MKKCPKCNAEIQEEARFCLYCMTSFEEKQTIENSKANDKRWLYIIVAVLVVVLVTMSVVLVLPKSNDFNESNNHSNNSFFSGDSNTSADNNDPTSNKPHGEKGSGGETFSSSSKQTATSSNTTTNTTSAHATTNTTSAHATTNTPSTNTGSQSNTTTNTTSYNITGGTVNSNPDTIRSRYSYIEATVENAYPTGSSVMFAPDNAIVITKVNYKEESGHYVIPDTIDGKKVAAIMPSAFCDPSISLSVKIVTLPATVRTIWNNAFADCINLTDLYIKSAVIGIYEDAFPDLAKRNDNLVIHCKSDCRNFDFYYYRNIADNYDAEYEEWNG